MFTSIESPAFDHVRGIDLDDDEYSALPQFMMRHPEAGAVVRGSGGLRKLRWRRQGSGKRGGLRVIYSVPYRPSEFWMFTLYAKSSHENAPAHILRRLMEDFEQ